MLGCLRAATARASRSKRRASPGRGRTPQQDLDRDSRPSRGSRARTPRPCPGPEEPPDLVRPEPRSGASAMAATPQNVSRVTSCRVRGGRTPLMLPKPLFRTTLPLASTAGFRDGPIGQAREADGAVHARELRVVEGVEGVEAHLEPDPLSEREALRERESRLLTGGPWRKYRADSVPSLPG